MARAATSGNEDPHTPARPGLNFEIDAAPANPWQLFGSRYPAKAEIRPGSEQSTLSERHNLIGDDHVVQDAHVHQSERVLETTCDGFIGTRGLRYARGMIVRQDYSCGIVVQDTPHDLPRMNAGTVYGPAKKFLEGHYPMPIIEEQAGKDLVWVIPQMRGKKRPRGRRGRNRVAALQYRGQMPTAHFEHGLQLGVFGRTQASRTAELGLGRLQQRAQPSEMREQIARQVHRALSGDTRAEKNRQKLGIGQRARSARQKLFPRTFVQRPIGYCHIHLPVVVRHRQLFTMSRVINQAFMNA